MRTIGILLLLLAIGATATWTTPASGQDKKAQEKKRKGKLTISKETTFVTAPLDKQGHVDYVTALNERMRQGVTPENNANVLIWQALGPHPERATMPAEFFRWLGIPAPPERGDYFIDLNDYLKEHTKIDPGKQTDAFWERFERASRRPWKADDEPHLAGWLKANEKPLAVAVEASKRTHYFSPLVPHQREKGLTSSLLPSVQRCRGLASALAARAMLRVGQGKEDEAWHDLLACHRLARLIAHGGTLIEFLVGVSLDGIASQADLAFLAGTKPDAKYIKGYLHDLQNLPPFPAVADRVDLAERFTLLEIITLIDRHGLRALEGLAGNQLKDLADVAERALRDVDWDPALKNANRWYDRLAADLREKDPGARRKKMRQFDTDVRALKAETSDLETLVLLLDEKGNAQERGKRLGDVLITMLIPAVHKVQEAADRAQQIRDNLTVAFALEEYRKERGGYPKTLDALAPDYLQSVPGDLFSGKALIYRPAFPKTVGFANGYLLYSVGVNGKDEGGRTYGDQPPGDDLPVRMPLPELRRP
jgi:hypothetical protein